MPMLSSFVVVYVDAFSGSLDLSEENVRYKGAIPSSTHQKLTWTRGAAQSQSS
jgi:hypothetical protein